MFGQDALFLNAGWSKKDLVAFQGFDTLMSKGLHMCCIEAYSPLLDTDSASGACEQRRTFAIRGSIMASRYPPQTCLLPILVYRTLRKALGSHSPA